VSNTSDSVLRAYLSRIRRLLRTGEATEHTYRPALKDLLDALGKDLQAINEPKRLSRAAPDFALVPNRTGQAVGYVETKLPDANLAEVETSEQLLRYRKHLDNLLLTNYLEFRWYTAGSLRRSARLGVLSESKVLLEPGGYQAVAELLDAFLNYEGEKLGDARELAEFMARLAHFIRQEVLNLFANEASPGFLHSQFEAFRKELIKDLEPDQFADMYAQTLAYGLFSARAASPGALFDRAKAWEQLPPTNPFLRSFFYQLSGPDLDPQISPYVDDLVRLLARADMHEILKHFGKATRREDPIVHFYETFLAAYDPAKRKQRGVYYTPEPVVSYIVRSVDWLLRTRFDCPMGLADPEAFILDPATGTGTFLYFVIAQIYEYFHSRGQAGLWQDYVRDHLLPRLFGFELLMAPYAVAHLKLAWQLEHLGYDASDDERLGVYLTNALEPANDKPGDVFAPWLVQEAQEADAVKREKPIMVVLGNPPYSVNSFNTGEWITNLLKRAYYTVDGRPLGEANPKVLLDDYVKFIRFGEWRLQQTGKGILAFITNHGYLDNPTFRGMRQHLLNSFSELFLLNLHGNSKKKEVCPDGSPDENVFDIQQGVSLLLAVKQPGAPRPVKVYYADLWGTREYKYAQLDSTDASNTEWQELNPKQPFYLFEPFNAELISEFYSLTAIPALFPMTSTGIKTHRDHFVFDFDRSALEARIATFLDPALSDDEVAQKLGLKSNRDWKLPEKRKLLQSAANWKDYIKPALYRPFDVRWLFYHKNAIDFGRPEVMHHLLAGPNLALCVGRQGHVVGPSQWNLVFCSKNIADFNLFYRGGHLVFPLYLYPKSSDQLRTEDTGHVWPPGLNGRRPNLDFDLVQQLAARLALPFVPEPDSKPADEKRKPLAERGWFGPEDLFYYVYALLHSPAYRERYRDFLKLDFPRLPFTSDRALFARLASLGAQLVALHLLEAPELKNPENWLTSFPTPGDNRVEKGFPKYHPKTRRVRINSRQAFEGVPQAVWDFQIGGYRVAQKWLKDRRGRTLSSDELTHYQQVILALARTLDLMRQVDEAIPAWPLE